MNVHIANSWLGMIVGASLLAGMVWLIPTVAWAHCDTLDGPVVAAARLALGKGDLTPTLKWIKPAYEKELHAAFEKTLMVRGKGPDAKELADTYFFETLVRLHRAGEGAPYEGLKPAGLELAPAVVEGDKALETGKVDKVIKLLKHGVEEGVEKRFNKVMELKEHANDSIAAGRAYVEAYVDYIHYVEGLYMMVTGESPHGGMHTGHHTVPQAPAGHNHGP